MTADPWQVVPASQVTRAADGSAVTWLVPLSGGAAAKLLWDTSSLSGSGGRQIGARFGVGPYLQGRQDVQLVPARPRLLAALGARGRPGLHGRHDDRREVRLKGDRHPGELHLLRRYEGQEHGRRQEDVRILHGQR